MHAATLSSMERSLAVNGISQAIQNATAQTGSYRHKERRSCWKYAGAWPYSLDLSQRHKQDFWSAKSYDLRANRIATRITDITQFTQRDVCWTERFNYEPDDIAHLAVSR